MSALEELLTEAENAYKKCELLLQVGEIEKADKLKAETDETLKRVETLLTVAGTVDNLEVLHTKLKAAGYFDSKEHEAKSTHFVDQHPEIINRVL